MMRFHTGRALKGPRFVAFFVFPFHAHIAADGQQAQRIQRFALLPAPQLRPHADGKFVYFDAAPLRGEEMAQFMNEDERAEHHNGDQQCGDE